MLSPVYRNPSNVPQNPLLPAAQSKASYDLDAFNYCVLYALYMYAVGDHVSCGLGADEPVAADQKGGLQPANSLVATDT